MDIEFKKFTEFNRGIMYEILKDAYSFDERCAICWDEDWKQTDDFFFDNNRVHIGIYCSRCGKWLKWADKDERNLRMKQVDVLDKIIAEIRNDWQLNKYPASPFSCGLRRAMDIIDKYKAESEGDKE